MPRLDFTILCTGVWTCLGKVKKSLRSNLTPRWLKQAVKIFRSPLVVVIESEVLVGSSSATHHITMNVFRVIRHLEESETWGKNNKMFTKLWPPPPPPAPQTHTQSGQKDGVMWVSRWPSRTKPLEHLRIHKIDEPCLVQLCTEYNSVKLPC